jgi:hypothetical protein
MRKKVVSNGLNSSVLFDGLLVRRPLRQLNFSLNTKLGSFILNLPLGMCIRFKYVILFPLDLQILRCIFTLSPPLNLFEFLRHIAYLAVWSCFSAEFVSLRRVSLFFMVFIILNE